MTAPGDPEGSNTSDSVITQSQRSISRSSITLHAYRDRPASPTSSLRAILCQDKAAQDDPVLEDASLFHSYRSAPPEQIQFAEYVLDTAAKLRAWSEELESWPWPGGFDNGDVVPHHTSVVPSTNGASAASDYNSNAEPLRRIRSELEDIDITEMKQRALDIYLPGGAAAAPSNLYSNLQDTTKAAGSESFNALVSVVLLQVLPYHSKASSLAITWSARIAVSRLVPSLLSLLSEASDSLSKAWTAIGFSRTSKSSSDLPNTLINVKTEEELAGLRGSLQSQVSSVGQVLDYMLDLLEGLSDTLPELWIDWVDELEADYSEWIVAAQNWLLHQDESDDEKTPVMIRSDASLANAEDEPVNPQEFNEISYLADPSESESEDGLVFDDPPITVPEQPSGSVFNGSSKQLSRDQIHPTSRDISNPDPATDTAPTFFNSDDESSVSDKESLDSPNDHFIDSYYNTVGTTSEDGNYSARNGPLDEESPHVTDDHLIDPYQNTVGSTSKDETNYAQNVPPDDESHHVAETSMLSDHLDHWDESEVLPDESSDQEIDESDALPEIDAKTNGRELVSSESPIINSFPSPGPNPDPQPNIEHEPIFGQSIQRDRHQTLSTDEKLERQIDSILTSIPARINFKRTRPGYSGHPRSSTPESRATMDLKSMQESSPRPDTPALTLAPAETKEPRAAKFSGDSPIRLYYLWQAGRQKPIKLFVRLVGEHGERVMVRVGGGWAELAEYLREYAAHHSRTIIPEPHEELQAVDLRQPSNSRVFSLPSARSDANPSSSPPRVTSPGGDDIFGSSPPQRFAKIPDESLQVRKNRSGLMLVTKSSNLQDTSPEAETKTPEHDGHSRENTLQEGSSPISSEKKGWLGGVVNKAKKWKAERGSANRSASSNSPQSTHSTGLEPTDGSK